MREVRKSAYQTVLPAFAKINLRLDIGAKREDGYHQLRTIFQTVSLCDELRLRVIRRPAIELKIVGNEALSEEPAENNLVYRAVDLLRRDFKIRSGVQVELIKKIPAGGGLGGGSSDAAAALLGYLRLIRRALPLARLLEIAASLGADVPFFLFGGRALGVNRGDEIYPLADISTLPVLVVCPRDLRVATPDAFRWVDEAAVSEGRLALSKRAGTLTKTGANPKLWEFCALSWSARGSGLSNDFEEPVFQRYTRLEGIKRKLLQTGAAEASLAGSGSAVFGVFPSPAMARRAAVRFPHDQTFVCETVSRDRYLRAVKRARVVR